MLHCVSVVQTIHGGKGAGKKCSKIYFCIWIQENQERMRKMGSYIVIGIVVLVIVYVMAVYNVLVKMKNTVTEAFAAVDVYLKKRWDLVPNLVEIVKRYAKHEEQTLENVVKLRNNVYDNASEEGKLKANTELAKGLANIMMLAESYPDLKANQNFLDLSAQLSKVEEDIANARKYYNAVVKDYNNRVQMFPANLIAGIFGYKVKPMFEAEESEKKRVEVKF